MRITEMFTESQIDELSLGTADKSYRVGNLAGRGVGAVKNAWNDTKGVFAAARQGYNAGKAGVNKNPYINREVPNPQIEPTLNPNQPMAAGTPSPATAPQPQAPTTPAPAPQNTATPGQVKPKVSAPRLNARPVGSDVESIKKAYTSLTPQERAELKQELDVLDDQDRLASGTNESRKEFYSRFLGQQL